MYGCCTKYCTTGMKTYGMCDGCGSICGCTTCTTFTDPDNKEDPYALSDARKELEEARRTAETFQKLAEQLQKDLQKQRMAYFVLIGRTVSREALKWKQMT